MKIKYNKFASIYRLFYICLILLIIYILALDTPIGFTIQNIIILLGLFTISMFVLGYGSYVEINHEFISFCKFFRKRVVPVEEMEELVFIKIKYLDLYIIKIHTKFDIFEHKIGLTKTFNELQDRLPNIHIISTFKELTIFNYIKEKKSIYG